MQLLIPTLELKLIYVRKWNPWWLISWSTVDSGFHCKKNMKQKTKNKNKKKPHAVRFRKISKQWRWSSKFHVIFKFAIRLDRVAVVQTLKIQYGSYEIFTRSQFHGFQKRILGHPFIPIPCYPAPCGYYQSIEYTINCGLTGGCSA